MPHVFISYSRKDTTFAETLERDLNTRGIVTWRDKTSIVGSEDWYTSIVQGLENATAVILVVTPNADESRWVRREALYADELGVHTIPIWPERYAARLNLHFLLIEKQPIYCDGSDYASGFAQLIAKLGDLSEATPATRRMGVPPEHDRATEIAYLNFLLSEMKGELRTARYVNLGATRENTVFRKPSASAALDEFEMSFDRFAPLVKAECLHDDDLDRAGEPVEDARDPLREMTRAILLGEPGSGKTTTLQQLAIDLARAAQDDPDAPLPVFVPLRSYRGAEQFSEFARAQLGPLQSQYERLLTEGRLVLLCDALNEMQRHAKERDLVDEVRGYLRDCQLWVVSCRVRDYQEELQTLPDVGKVRLEPLDLPRIKDVIDRRFHDEPERAAAVWADLKGSDDLLAVWQAFELANKVDSFWVRPSRWGLPDDMETRFPHRNWLDASRAWHKMHRDRRRMMLLCRNPFMLFMVCGTFERLGHLPSNRGALFATFVDNLLRREEQNSRATGRAWIDTNIIRAVLAGLAYSMQRSETGTEISRVQADNQLKQIDDTIDTGLLLRLAVSASLVEAGETVRFTHQLVQEYFASEALGRAMDVGLPASNIWPAENWWEWQGWEETAIILTGVRGDPEGVAQWIAPAQPEIAYQALTECGIDVNLDEIQPETRAALVDSANAKKGEPNPVGRVAAYRVLGLFDADKRPGVGLRAEGAPDIVWSETIGAGPFQMGGDPEVPDYGGKWDGAKFDLRYPFWIARYPVTYAQYEAFFQAGGYQERKYWTQSGWEWKGSKTEPEYGWNKPQWHISNHPVIGVTWYEAVAFTQWLDRLRQEDKLVLPPGVSQNTIVRLPTEAEWEKAARYPDERKFPWGNNPDLLKLNSYESGIRRTSAVGIFPAGGSSTGAHDLSGNVWEWCLSQWNDEYHFPEDNCLDGNAARVLRGGSEDRDIDDARCAYREGNYPHTSGANNVSFRVVCSTPVP